MKQLLLLFSALTLVCCSRQEVIDADTVSILNLTKTQQDDIIVEHIIVHSDRYELTLTEQQAYEKGVAKVNYKLHSQSINSANSTIQRLRSEGKDVGLATPISSIEYQTKCPACSPPIFTELKPDGYYSNRISFTSVFTCIDLFGNLGLEPSINCCPGNADKIGHAGNLIIEDLDGEMYPSGYVAPGTMHFSVSLHKHSQTTIPDFSSPIFTKWNIRVSFLSHGPNCIQNLFYSDIRATCI